MCPSCLASALRCCLVLPRVFQHLRYFLARASQPLSILKSLEGCDLGDSVDFFCPSELLVFHRPNSSEFSLLSARLVVFSGSSCPYFPFYLGEFSKFPRSTVLRLQSMSPEVLSLPSVIFVWWQRMSLEISSLLSDRPTMMAFFPRFCDEIEINIEVIEEVLELFLVLIITYLPFHVLNGKYWECKVPYALCKRHGLGILKQKKVAIKKKW